MVPFAGWEMPLQFQGILAETRAVRARSGLFDVSHMGRIWVRGRQASALLDWTATGNISGLAQSRARYGLLCVQDGGILDDGIVYNLGPEEYLLVCNASNFDAVWAWLAELRDNRFQDTELEDRTLEVGMIAFQGPDAPAVMERLFPGLTGSLRLFRCASVQLDGVPVLVARTGYTGEDGFELMPPADASADIWKRLLEMGAVPCGLGARDVLRLEAGLLLHGTDMNIQTNPYEAGLDRFVVLEKESVYSAALRQVARQGVGRKLTGFLMFERGIPRHGYAILKDDRQDEREVGEVTSGGYSPTLDRYIGLGYVAMALTAPGSRFVVDIRGRRTEAEAVALPFYSRRRS
jgi:aminomethyltransferase